MEAGCGLMSENDKFHPSNTEQGEMICQLLQAEKRRHRETRPPPHLVHLPPLGRVCVVDVFGGEGLRADPQYGVRVGQTGHDPFHVVILGCQVLGLH